MRALSRPFLRWAAPLAVVLAVGATGVVASTAVAEPHLPPTTPEQLLVDLQSVSVNNLSGTVEQEANLGIPAIPGAGGSDSSEFNSCSPASIGSASGMPSPTKARVALYGDLGESDLIRNGTDVWTWSSRENKATHRTVKAEPQTAGPTPSDLPKTPQEAANRVLKEIGPTTELTVESAVTVAGRPAYDLVARPKDQGSLVTEARLAVDGETHLPLRVEVFAGDTTVLRTAYTEIDFSQPDPKVFDFTPPPGADVTEAPAETPKSESPGSGSPDQADEPKVVGDGWTTVVINKVPANLDRTSGPDAEQLRAFLQQLPQVSGSWGTGRLLSGTAFSAIVTDDGRLAIGSVTPELLYAALQK